MHYQLVEVGADGRQEVLARGFTVDSLVRSPAVQDAIDAEREQRTGEAVFRNRRVPAPIVLAGEDSLSRLQECRDAVAAVAAQRADGVVVRGERAKCLTEVINDASLWKPVAAAPRPNPNDPPRFVFGAFSASAGPVLPPEDDDYDAPLIVEGPAVTRDEPVDDVEIHNAEFLAARDDLDDDGDDLEPTEVWDNAPQK